MLGTVSLAVLIKKKKIGSLHFLAVSNNVSQQNEG